VQLSHGSSPEPFGVTIVTCCVSLFVTEAKAHAVESNGSSTYAACSDRTEFEP
jgi:hypothetical protein